MNSKGFGFIALLGFVALVGLVLFSLYMFLTSVLRNIYMPTVHAPNYKNEYIVYMKEHNINLEK